MIVFIFLFSFYIHTVAGADFNIVINTDDKTLDIAFGSCSDQSKPMKHWGIINKYNPNVLVLMGDNVYGDFIDKEAINLKNAYKKLGLDKGYKKLASETLILPMWDDHDYGKNDAGKEWKHKAKAEELFLDFFNIKTNDIRRKREGLYASWMIRNNFNNVKLILLDTRTFKDNFEKKHRFSNKKYKISYDKKKTILGVKQWIWLEKELLEKADLYIIVSSIQVISKDHGWESWNKLFQEREKLLKMISKTNGKVFLISGDRHFSGIYSEKLENKNSLVEFSSSSLNKTRTGSKERERTLVSKIVDKNNFGMLKINYSTKKLEAYIYNSEAYERKNFFLKYKADF